MRSSRVTATRSGCGRDTSRGRAACRARAGRRADSSSTTSGGVCSPFVPYCHADALEIGHGEGRRYQKQRGAEACATRPNAGGSVLIVTAFREFAKLRPKPCKT